MARRHFPHPLEAFADDSLTFADVTTLALMAVSSVATAAVLFLGLVCAAHRIGAALGHL